MAQINFTTLPVEHGTVQVELQNILQSAFLLNNNIEFAPGITVDEGDVFQCGKCKEQFTTFSAFVSHKNGNCKDCDEFEDCSVPSEVISIDHESNSNIVNQPIILNDSSILSFAVDSDHLGVPATSQPLQAYLNEDENQYLENTLRISTVKGFNLVQNNDGLQNGTFLPETFLLTKNFKNPTKVCLSSDENTTEMLSLSLINENEEPALPDEKGKVIRKELEYKKKCMYCEKKFKKKFDLQQHLRSHTGERPFQCIVCGRAFAQKSNVMKHMSTHKVWPKQLITLPKNQVQTVPGSKTNDSKDKDDGTIIVNKSFVCQFCPDVFDSFSELKSHWKNHASQKVYKCIQKECNATFEDLYAFLEHSQSHTNEARYKCHICYCKFNSLEDLGVHQSCHDTNIVKSSSKTVTCRKCKSKFMNPESLERHMAVESHRYPCSICQKVFTCERFLRRHLPTHTNKANYLCPICAKPFKTEHYLNVHKIVHSTQRPYSCQICRASFSRKDKLSRHNLIHENSKKYKCPFNKKLGCDKEFSRKDKLNQHILTHASPRKSFCNLCTDFLLKKMDGTTKTEDLICIHDIKNTKLKQKYSNNKTKRNRVGNNETPVEEDCRRVRKDSGGDDVPTIEIVVMPVSKSSDRSGETTFQVMFPSKGDPATSPSDQQVPIYTIKPFK